MSDISLLFDTVFWLIILAFVILGLWKFVEIVLWVFWHINISWTN
jgi:hypothetical protein